MFSESGDGQGYVGGTIGFVRTGSNSMGDLVLGTRATAGDATTLATENLRVASSGITVSGNVKSDSKNAYNVMAQYYYQRTSIGTGTVDLRVPPGGDGSTNPNSYPMPRAGKVMSFSLHYYGAAMTLLGNDTWRIRKFSGGTETTLDTVVDRSSLANPTGYNYTKTIELSSPMTVAAGDILMIKRTVSGNSSTHIAGILYVSYDL